MAAPPTLAEALAKLAERKHALLAGGTEIMVALAAGRLPRTPLISIGHLKELRFIEVNNDRIIIGSGTTFTDLQCSNVIKTQLPLLSQAASWTGSIANQNRGTLGGNVANASPAADSAPALLVYEAEVFVVSKTGERTIPYSGFHLGYKKTALAADELVHSFRIPTAPPGSIQFIRKVGARNAQAISKVALAGLGLIENGIIRDIRIAAASVRDMPYRFADTERTLVGRKLSAETIKAARNAVIEEARPIDDIRSTAQYRSAVVANLIEEFLRLLAGTGTSGK